LTTRPGDRISFTMTLAISWLYEGGDTLGTWPHEAGDWHRGAGTQALKHAQARGSARTHASRFCWTGFAQPVRALPTITRKGARRDALLGSRCTRRALCARERRATP